MTHLQGSKCLLANLMASNLLDLSFLLLQSVSDLQRALTQIYMIYQLLFYLSYHW